ncbi:MAG: hypothetical protein AMXMBFR33_13440 [Candidatus Xenobia bacterium]
MKVTQIPRQVVAGAAHKVVSLYQDYISADYNGERGAHCMYTPSCSAFMKEAVEQDGMVQGAFSGLMRLKRCSSDQYEERLKQFVVQLATTPPDQVGTRFAVEDQAALERLADVHQILGRMQSELKAGRASEAKALNEEWVKILKDELRVLVVEHPDHDPTAPPRFKIIHNRPWVQPDKKKLGPLAGAATATGSVVGGVLGGLTGLCAFGLVGASYGAFRGVNSGLGQNASLEASWTKRYGPSAEGSKLDKTLAGWHESMARAVGSLAASAVLGPAGFVAGLAVGLGKGLKLGAIEGWHGGRVLGRNLTRDLVDGQGESHRHPVGCGCGCQVETPTSVRESLPMVPMAASRPWTIVGHLDATASELEPMRTRQVIDFERNPHPDAHVVLQLRREGKDVESLKRSATFKIYALPALAVAAGAAAFGLFGLAGIPALLVGSQLAQGAAFSIYQGIKDRRTAGRVAEAHEEASWSGTRTYELAAGGVHTPGRNTIQTHTVERSSSTDAPSPEALSNLWVRSMKRYPSEHTAVLLEGHGLGYKRLAGMKMADVSKALELTHAQTGKKVDVLIMEACEMANLEALKDLGQHARYAVVSQDSLWEAGLPWTYILPRLGEIDKDPKTFGEMLVKRHGGNEVVPTLSLVDLEKLPALTASVEELAAIVQEKLPVVGEHFQQAAAQTRHFPREEKSTAPGWRGTLENLWLGLKRFVNFPGYGDLGSFLEKLQQGCPDAEVAQLAARCQALLQEAVVVNRNEASLGAASGLSIQMPDPIFFPGQYRKDTGMESWGGLIHSVRPWRTRVSSVTVEGLHTGLTAVAPVTRKYDLLNKI